MIDIEVAMAVKAVGKKKRVVGWVIHVDPQKLTGPQVAKAMREMSVGIRGVVEEAVATAKES